MEGVLSDAELYLSASSVSRSACSPSRLRSPNRSRGFGSRSLASAACPFAPLNYAIPHWPLSDLANGIMGFSETGYGQGLQFPCIVTPTAGGAILNERYDAATFTDPDLYLMGLLPADQVGPHVVFPRGTTSAELFALCGGGTWLGQLETVTIQDIVRRAGTRVPDSAHSSHAFRVATVIVSKDGLLSAEAMAFYSHFARRAEATQEMLYHSGFAKGTAKPFALSTRGLGTLDARLLHRAADAL
jgi:hypothetical protein